MDEPSEITEDSSLGQTDAWEQLEQIVASGDAEAAHNYLKDLPPGEDARVMNQLSHAEQQEFITLLKDEDAAGLMEALPEIQAGQILSRLPPEQAAPIFDEMNSDEQVDLLDQLSES